MVTVRASRSTAITDLIVTRAVPVVAELLVTCTIVHVSIVHVFMLFCFISFFMLFCLISLHYVNGINKMMMMMMISVHIAGLPPMG